MILNMILKYEFWAHFTTLFCVYRWGSCGLRGEMILPCRKDPYGLSV